MKQKFVFKTNDGEKEIFLKKQGKSYVAIYNGKQYSPAPNGTRVTFNGQEKIVDQRVIFFNVDGTKFITFFNKNAGASITPEVGTKVKSSKIANNLAASFNLLIGFLIIIVIIAVLCIVL